MADTGQSNLSDTPAVLKAIARWVLVVEPLWLALMLFAFWYPSPQRDSWMVLLAGIPVMMAARAVVYRRLWTRFPLDVVFLIFIALMLANIRLAPYTRGLIMLGRPLSAMALCLYFVEYARLRGKLDALLVTMVFLALLVAFLALTGSQWNSKSDQMRPILDLLPRFTHFPAAEGGFNANEIAGALAWLTPVMAGMALWRAETASFRASLIRWGGLGAFIMLFAALFLGQSRFALAGMLLALALMTPLVIHTWKGRAAAWAGIGCIILLEIMIIRHVFSPADLSQQVERDEDSLSVRFDIWRSAVDIMRDYPLTGVGLNMFRDSHVRERYPVPTFKQPVLPHTHNELLQFGADMGLPGIALFIVWHGVIGWMLFQAYRKGDGQARLMAAALAGGLLAHAGFGLGDAITLWDRFAFVFWWLLALASAQSVIIHEKPLVELL